MTNPLTNKIKKGVRLFLLIGGAVVLAQYYPIIKSETGYLLLKIRGQTQQKVALTTPKTADKEKVKSIIPINKEFGIVIPKIGVNMAVIPQVR